MGIFYNPPQPNIGAQQPLDTRKLTPPQSGPAPQNPPLTGARIPAAVLISWAAITAAVVLPSPPLIPQAQAAASFPFTGARVPPGVIDQWSAPAAPVQTGARPAQSGPIPQNPPLVGSRVPAPVLVAWIPPAPASIVAINLDPPIAGAAPQNPPFTGTRVPDAVLAAWSAPFQAVDLVSAALTPAPPIAGTPCIGQTQAVLNWWIPADPPVQAARNLNPALQGGAPTVVPVPLGGQQVPQEVLNWSLVAQPLPPVAINLEPPISGPAPQNPPVTGARVPAAVLVAWLPPDPAFQTVRNLNPPIGIPGVNPPPINGSRVPAGVLTWWLPPDPVPPLVADLIIPPISGPAPQNPPPVGARVPASLLIAWLPPDPAVQTVRNLNPPIGIPAVNAPPINGSRIPAPVMTWWLPPDPAPPIVADLIIPPISGPAPQNPPVLGVRVPAAQAWWFGLDLPQLRPLPDPALFAGAPVSAVPPVRFAFEVIAAWQSSQWAAQVTPPLSPALYPQPAVVFVPAPRRLAIEALWVPEAALQVRRLWLPVSGPVPVAIQFPSRALPPGLDWWLVPPPMFQVARNGLPVSGPYVSPCPPSDPAFLAAYRAALRRNGQSVTFVRNLGVAPNITQVRVTVTARVMTYVPDTNVVGRTDFGQRLGTITQGDRKIIVLCPDLAAQGFPVPVQKHDKVIVQGETLDVISVDQNTRLLAGAYELVVAGV